MPLKFPTLSANPFDLSASAAALIEPLDKIKSHTIKVTDSYTLDADDTLKLKGNVGFKLLAGRDGPVDLTIDGAVSMTTDKHLKLGGIGSTRAPNGEAHVTLGEDATLDVINATVGAQGAFGVALQAATSSLANAGDIHVSSAGSLTAGVGLLGKTLTLDNSGDIHVEAGPGGIGAGAEVLGATVDIDNTGTIEVEGGVANTAVGIVVSTTAGGTLDNDGDITVSGGGAFGIQVTGPLTSMTNTGDITATCTAASGGSSAAFAMTISAAGGTAAVSNSGHIQAIGGAGVAIGVGVVGVASFHNTATGVIEASSDSVAALPYHSIGLALGLSAGGVATNDGTISGELAIASGDATGSGTVSDDIVVNSSTGVLNGKVVLGGGADSLTNAGAIHGQVLMGAGDDTVDSHLGTLDGAVFGGLGADTLTGSAASDIFAYATAGDSTTASHDLITNLANADQIDLSAIDAVAGGSDDAFHLVSSFGGHAGELVVSYDGGTGLTTIAGDTDGDGTADLVITATADHHDFTNFVL